MGWWPERWIDASRSFLFGMAASLGYEVLACFVSVFVAASYLPSPPSLGEWYSYELLSGLNALLRGSRLLVHGRGVTDTGSIALTRSTSWSTKHKPIFYLIMHKRKKSSASLCLPRL